MPDSVKEGTPRFKSVEDAEKVLTEKETMIGRQSTEIGTLRREVEDLKTRIPEPKPVRDDEGNDGLNEELISQELLATPGRFMRNFGRGILQHVGTIVAGEVDRKVEIARTVDKFLDKNPMVVKNVKLFNSYLVATDAKKSIEDRLNEAHASLKSDIADVAKDQSAREAAERKERERTGTVLGEEGRGELEVGDTKQTDDTPQTSESYLAERLAARSKALL